MNGAGVRLSVAGGALSGTSESAAPERDALELWFTLARRRWSSLVLVPADEGPSLAGVAAALASVGTRLRNSPVAAIVAESMDYDSARLLADLQLRIQGTRADAAAIDVEARAARPSPVEVPAPFVVPAPGGPGSPAPTAHALPPSGRVVLAIRPVAVEPLGIAIAQAADAVVLCLQLGKTRLGAARRTIELIGREQIAGACLVQ
jgi:hypothetical protein